MEKTNKERSIRFLDWLSKRLVYKHQYTTNDIVVATIINLKNDLSKPYNFDISDADLDRILSHYYVDFHLDKTEELGIGFSDSERQNLRSTTRSIVNDVVNGIVDYEPQIK